MKRVLLTSMACVDIGPATQESIPGSQFAILQHCCAIEPHISPAAGRILEFRT